MNYRVRKLWPVLLSGVLLGSVFLILVTYFFPLDQEGYREVLESANPSLLSESDARYRAKQYRQGVQKEIWFNKEGNRMQMFLTSADAELVFEKQGEDQEIVEQMTDVKCFIQEELYYLLPDGREAVKQVNGRLLVRDANPSDDGVWFDEEMEGLVPMQSVRYIEGDTAEYYCTTDKLFAENVAIISYAVPGHQLIPSLVDVESKSSGFAKSLEISLFEKDEKKFGEVIFAMKGGGELLCEEAEIQERDRMATFLGGEQKKPVVYKIPGFGTCTAKELHLKLDNENKVEFLKSVGGTTIQSENEEEDLDFILKCHGELLLDHKQNRVMMHSPQNVEGEVEDAQQLFYQDGKGKIFADEAVITYEMIEDKCVPLQLILDGHVRLLHREGPLLQYALADHVVFSLNTQEMHFKALNKKRVLFYDKVNNLQISAPELKMKRDEMTKKESIKGVGDVRFCFMEEEFNLLRKRFLLEQNSL